MNNEKLKDFLEKNLSPEDREKVEEILLEESMQRKQKIELLKKLIAEKKYSVDPEKVAEKILKFLELEQED
jgi:anti-sigma28 factor (negative regulator of flagellin synthesis)